MITAKTDEAFDALARRLEVRARETAEAHIEETTLARRGHPDRWRRAGLLWPLFAKG